MDMLASVTRANAKALIVRDFKTNEEVVVIYKNSLYFLPGCCVRIRYDGEKTRSVPPRITAGTVWEIECPD